MTAFINIRTIQVTIVTLGVHTFTIYAALLVFTAGAVTAGLGNGAFTVIIYAGAVRTGLTLACAQIAQSASGQLSKAA